MPEFTTYKDFRLWLPATNVALGEALDICIGLTIYHTPIEALEAYEE